MALTFGRDTFLATGKESSYGTAVAVDRYHRAISTSLRRRISRVPRPHLVGSDTAAMNRAHYTQNDLVEGDIELEMYYEGFGRWLEAALGKTPSTSGPSGGIYTHTYLLGGALPSLTIEQAIGRPVSGNRRSEVFEGCVIASARMRVGVGDMPRFSASIIGETSSARSDVSGSATYSSSDLPVEFRQAGSLGFNSQSYSAVKSLEIAIDNGLDRRMHLGTLNTKQPQIVNFRKITMRATMEYEDENLLNAYLADTQGDVTITFTGTGSRTFGVTLQNGYITDYGDPIQGPGIIERTVEWTAESDGTDDGFAIVIANTQSSALAA